MKYLFALLLSCSLQAATDVCTVTIQSTKPIEVRFGDAVLKCPCGAYPNQVLIIDNNMKARCSRCLMDHFSMDAKQLQINAISEIEANNNGNK